MLTEKAVNERMKRGKEGRTGGIKASVKEDVEEFGGGRRLIHNAKGFSETL